MAFQLGTENRKQVILASVLGVVALFFIGKTIADNFGGSAPPAAPTPVAATPASPAAATSTHTAVKVASTASLDPTLHPELMAPTEALTYSGTGRNIFSLLSAPPKIEAPIRPARPQPVVNAGPPPPPPPPPIDLKFYGFSSVKSGSRRAFLLHGDDIFIAGEGDVVNRRYKVLHILPFSVQVEDLPYNNTQTLPLIQN